MPAGIHYYRAFLYYNEGKYYLYLFWRLLIIYNERQRYKMMDFFFLYVIEVNAQTKKETYTIK